MSLDFCLLGLSLVFQNVIQQSACNYPDWHGGDWVMENLKGTDEPIGVAGEWSDYVHTLAGEYDEKREIATTTDFVTDKNDAPSDWYPLTPREIPYLAVLYRRDNGPSPSYKRFFEKETHPQISHVEPGTACGGALLTTRFVLSVCGCLVSLIAHVQGVTSPFIKNETFQDIYDIHDDSGQYKKVYMTHSLVSFEPNFKHGVEQDPTKWPTNGAVNCKNLLVELGDKNWNKGVRDDGKKAELLNSQLILVPVNPEVKTDHIKFFPRWPPHPVNDEEDPDFVQRVDIISIGMRFSRPPNKKFLSSISAASVEMKHCNAESQQTFTCNHTRVSRGTNYTCFCPTSAEFNLYGGTIGWPIVQHDELVGLTASARDSKNGYVAGAILSNQYVTILQDYIGKNLLIEQNTPATVYRQKDLAKKYFIYDYDALRSKYINGPASTATTKDPGRFLIFMACATWMGTTSVLLYTFGLD